jgi:tetratricopeptide (TPR) repeat protein
VRASPAAVRRRMRRSTRPQPWQWVLTGSIAVGSVAGGIASNILADLVDKNLGAVTWAAAGVAFLVAGLLTMLELRARRARELEREVEPRPVPAPPRQSGVSTDLPDTVGFVGMQGDVDWLIGAGHAAALVGRRASGTSACVVQTANVIRGEFPGGQLYLNLRARGRPLRPREVVDALCRKVGIGEDALRRAADADAAARDLRDRLGDRKILIVLDNVDSPEQVRPLLPPPEDCRLLLAGGPGLTALVDAGVAVRGLDQLSTAEAAELFAAAAHDGRSPYRDLETNEYVARIVDLAGRQPHAVRVLGSWMAKWEWSPQELVDALRQGLATDRPDATLTLLAARDRAYAALGGGARRLVRLLALVEEPLSRNAVAAVLGTNRGHADRMLDEAAAGEFIAVFADGRYGLQPLLLDYARIHLLCDEPPRHRVEAMSRLVRYLARQAERYAEAVVPEAPAGGEPAGWFARNESLLRKLVCEPWGRRGALPAEPPRPMRRWWLRLAMALCTWYAAGDRLDDWAAVCRAVLDSPVAARRAAVAGWAHNELGAVRRWQGDPHAAAVELTAAVKLRHRRGAAQSRTNLGLALLDQGDVDGALDQLQRARRQRSPSDRAGQALTDLALGVAFLARDEPRAARHHLILAANRFENIGDRRGYAAALTDLALAQWWLGERLDAAHAWNAALECHPAVHDPKGYAAALLNAGAIVAADPRRAGLARQLLEESLSQRRLNGRPEGRALLYLGDVAHAMKDPEDAKRLWDEAAGACEAAGDAEGAAAARGRPATRTEA